MLEHRAKPGDLIYVPSRYYHCALPKSPRVNKLGLNYLDRSKSRTKVEKNPGKSATPIRTPKGDSKQNFGFGLSLYFG